MSLIGQRLNVRCFLEGIEIPVISCVVQANINSFAVASINVIPLDELMFLQKRTMVHLFFYDYTIDEQVDFDDLSKYKVLFIGELSSRSFSKSPTGRSAVIQCIDLSSNWDLCYQYMLTYGPNGNFITEDSANWAGENAIFNNIVDGHAQVLARYLEQTPKTVGLQNVKGLLGGIISMIEALGGVINHRVGINDYFTISELKNKTLQQIVAEQDDDTAQRLFESKEFYQWLESGVTTLGELCTIRDMIRMLFNYIYYEVVPVTSPMYIPGDAQNSPTNEEIESDVMNTIIESIIVRLQDGLTNLRDKVTLDIRNIVENELSNVNKLTGSISGLSSNLNLTKQQKKELTKAESFLGHAEAVIKIDSSSMKKDVALVKKNLTSAIASLNKAVAKKPIKKPKDVKLDRLNSFIFRPECYFVAPPRCNVIFPEHETQFNYDKNDTGEITRLRLQSSMIFGIDSDRLLASFAYAPALKEIQELAKKQGTRGLRALLPWEKFGGIRPKFEHINEIDYVANKKQKELQSNIVGKAIGYKQKVANFNFFKHRFATRSINLNLKFNPFVVCGFPALILDKPFIVERDKAVDILNQGGGNLRDYSIDSDYIVKNIQELAKGLKAPTQYLGMVQSVTHTMDSSSGGSTMMVLSHARTHRITEDDFLVAFQQQKSKEAELLLKSTYLDAEELSRDGNATLLQFLIDATPQDAYTTKNKKKTPAPATKIVDRPQLKVDGLQVNTPAFKPDAIDEPAPAGFEADALLENVDGKQVLVPAKYGKLKPGSKGPLGGTIKFIQLTSSEIVKIPVAMGQVRGTKTKTTTQQKEKLAWRTAIIYEMVNSNRQNKYIPIEEVLRPSWFSPWYSNLYIGDKIYQPFIGTGSIVDQIVFKSPEGLSIQAVGAERQQVIQSLTDSRTLLTDVSNLTQSKLFNMPDIETAADILAFQYGEVRRLGLDANRFINDYTSRPIATITNIFGSSDLQYIKQGNKLKVASGTPGFHSTAISGYGDLLGLLDNPDLDYPTGNDKAKVKISKLLDPRPERRELVQQYAERLRSDGGLVIGLQG